MVGDAHSDGGRSDLRLARVLHSDMDVVPAEAAYGDVWAFLALVLLPDVAYWRYPNPPGDRVLGTDFTRHVFGRMWWRAQLVHSARDSDPYAALNVLGEAAFDQIYARRKALGGSPHLVRGILRVCNALDLRGLEERQILRNLLMRLAKGIGLMRPLGDVSASSARPVDLRLMGIAQPSGCR
ncbi:DUF6339 family protein [Actinomadura fibrosa]|uniref:DUF6339 family protein n=1 Tax=Actinomadura fibrosa TaxID=111802 RepID=A0ABW2XQH0_9ACTN|nr:DUF6339 family protein [Actinomadura fibrosa]